MPELPDLTAYLHALRSRIVGRPLARVRLGNPFLLRSVDPPLEAFEGRRLNDVGLLGKRLARSAERKQHSSNDGRRTAGTQKRLQLFLKLWRPAIKQSRRISHSGDCDGHVRLARDPPCPARRGTHGSTRSQNCCSAHIS